MPVVKKQETHYFDIEENYSKGMKFYEQYFDGRVNEILIGQTAPFYLYLDYVPERIYKSLPDVRLIFILRNPVDRAYSHYWHSWKEKQMIPK